jgi:ribosomal protein S4
MPHPSYLLNPGDMFQVDIERVMMATGKPKRPLQNQKALPSTPAEEPAESEEAEADAGAEAAAPEAAEGESETAAADAAKEKHMATLKQLKTRARKVMSQKDVHMRAKQKKDLRKFLKDVKAAMDSTRKPGDPSVAELTGVEAELTSLLSELSLTPAERKAQAKKAAIAQKEDGEGSSLGLLTHKQRAVLSQMIASERTNPHDPSKPYATPWSPRDWMSPFAFIPRYLEVNQRICAAVYLRHPVARPGRSEVPSPFSPVLSQLAFNWYLRRG